MYISKISYYSKRFKDLGIAGAIKQFSNRGKKRYYSFLFKQKALNQNANSTWQQIAKKHNLEKSFDVFLAKLKNKSFVDKVLCSDDFQNSLSPRFNSGSYILKQAAKACNHCFDFSDNNFYQDVRINAQKDMSLDECNFDIKTPWEASRFQQTFFLGKAFQQTQKEKFAKTFYNQVDDWINKNPFLLGVNWVCPMECAIRATNLIWGFYFFKNSKTIPTSFWGKFVCSLYDHANYLKNNWEKSDRPNNHYLSDLLGYFYLCFFFDDLKHFKKAKNKTYKTILKQFEHQVNADGSIYEGSTNYHKLVTEIFLHFYILCKTNNIKLPKTFLDKFNKMCLFLDDCSDCKNNLVQIGDNDSGKILCGLNPLDKTLRDVLSHYPDFGLTIIKNEKFHITFRHPTFNKKQPTGHFHQDALSVTLSINGIPILVDPGSYLYTSNPTWRNLMRSFESHNTFYIPELIPQNYLQNIDLFQLPQEELEDSTIINQNENCIEVENFYTLRDASLLRVNGSRQKLHRKIIFHEKKNLLKIEDWIKSPLKANWNFVFHPKIELIKRDKNTWFLKYKDSKIAQIKTTLNFKKVEGFYSPKYGKVEKCTKLSCKSLLDKKAVFLISAS